VESLLDKLLASAGVVLIFLGLVQIPGFAFELGQPYLMVGASVPHTIYAGSVVTLSTYAYYVSGGNAYWVSGASVSWSISGGSLSAVSGVTDSEGRAYTEWAVPNTPGRYIFTYSVSHPDFDLSYATKSIALDVLAAPPKKPTSVELTLSATSVEAGSAVSASAKVLSSGVTYVGASIVFRTSWGYTVEAPTDASGVATVTFTAPSAPGTYTVEAAFLGDSQFEASSQKATLTVKSRSGLATQLTLQIQSANSLMSVVALSSPQKLVFSGVLRSVDGFALSGKPVVVNASWGFEAQTYTLSDGSYRVSASPPVKGGEYYVAALFPGDVNYNPSSASATLNLLYDAVNPPPQGFAWRLQPALLISGLLLMVGAFVVRRRG